MTIPATGLYPSLADMLQALRYSVVVMLACGLGFLAGARRVETAVFTGWGIACLVFVSAGAFGIGLAPAAAFLGAAGAVGLLNWIWAGGERNAMAWRVLVLGAPTLLILLSLRTTAFDDFSFWAPNLIALCLTGHFPVAGLPLAASFMPGYPRGVALASYSTYLLGPDPSPAGILRLLATGAWWNILLMLAVAAALARILKIRLQEAGQQLNGYALWGLAGFSILLQSFLNPGFISKMTLTNMGDAATGSGLAMLTAMLFELFSTTRRKPFVVVEMAFTAAAVVYVRQDNFVLLAVFGFGVALGLLLWSGPGRLRRIGWLALAALPALLVERIWTDYALAQIPGGAHSLLAFKDWHWDEYHDTLFSAGKVLLSKGVYTLLAIGLAVAFVAMLAKRGPAGMAGKLLLTVITALVFGNAAFIMLTYLATSFTPVEVRTAVTFWRFLAQTAAAEMVALGCILPLSLVPRLPPRLAPWPLPAWNSAGRLAINQPAWISAARLAISQPAWISAGWLAISLTAAFLPVALLGTAYTFRTDLQFPAEDFLGIGQSLAARIPRDAKLLLLDNSDGSGYVAWIIKFGYQELGGGTAPVTISLDPQLSSPQAGPGTIPVGAYVVVTQSESRPPYFPGTNMQPWHAYLFRSEQSGLVPLNIWPIPAYGAKH